MLTTNHRKLAKFALMAALYKEQVGTRIRELRKDRRWSQKQLGERVGVEANTISRWERGANLGTTGNLERVASAFDLDVGEFMASLRPIDTPETDLVLERLDSIERKMDELLEHLAGEAEEGNPNSAGDVDDLIQR